MKQLALTLALIFTLGLNGFSQEVRKNPAKQTNEQKAETESVRAAKRLSLNDKQKSVFKQFALQRLEMNKPLRIKLKNTSDAATKEAITKEINANRDKFRANVNAMLNPEQQTKWAEMSKRHDEKGAQQKNRN